MRRRALALAICCSGDAIAQGPAVPIPDAASQYIGADWTEVAVVGDVIHVGVANVAGTTGPGRFDYARSADHGRTWTGASLFPPNQDHNRRLLASSQYVYALVVSGQGVLCRASSDGGVSWSAAVPVPAYTPSSGTDNHIAVAADGPVIAVLSGSSTGGNTWLNCSSSADGGATWRAPVVMDGRITESRLYVDGARIHAVLDGSSGTLEFRTSADAGQTWSSRLVVGPRGSPWSFRGAGSNLFVVFRDYFTGTVQVNRSADGGASWLPAPVVLGPGLTLVHAGTANADYVAVLLSGAITLWESPDLGATWNQRATPLVGFPLLAADDSGVLLVGEQYVPQGTIGSAVCSIDRGQTWSTAGTLSAPSGTVVFVSYYHRRTAHFRSGTAIVAQTSQACTFGGSPCSWHGTELLLSSNSGGTWSSLSLPPSHPAGYPFVAPVDGGFGVVVGDGRMGGSCPPQGLYSFLVAGHQPYGPAKPGSGGIAPALRAAGEPFLGRTATWHVERTLGGAFAALCASFAPANVPFGSGTLLLQQPIATVATGVTSGSGPGAGAIAASLAIPTSVALRGVAVCFQGFVLDPGAVDGFAASGAMQTFVF